MSVQTNYNSHSFGTIANQHHLENNLQPTPKASFQQPQRPIAIPFNQRKVYPITYQFGFYPNIAGDINKYEITITNLCSYLPIISSLVALVRIKNIAMSIHYKSPSTATYIFTAIRILPELIGLGSIFIIIDISLFVLRKYNKNV
jgi:hypothetical protein